MAIAKKRELAILVVVVCYSKLVPCGPVPVTFVYLVMHSECIQNGLDLFFNMKENAIYSKRGVLVYQNITSFCSRIVCFLWLFLGN